ncbi:hypothetical protein RDWZM_010460 [Blomia tropicalis]|uniref:RUN domain-containing protein n=1 Tax=Blomia tropicalis TaxID=40697 RepID=A0A9Q0M1X7_BLOTA|nr:hypothetical protein RDWZM_010460 [Blomia tropicalis]
MSDYIENQQTKKILEPTNVGPTNLNDDDPIEAAVTQFDHLAQKVLHETKPKPHRTNRKQIKSFIEFDEEHSGTIDENGRIVGRSRIGRSGRLSSASTLRSTTTTKTKTMEKPIRQHSLDERKHSYDYDLNNIFQGSNENEIVSSASSVSDLNRTKSDENQDESFMADDDCTPPNNGRRTRSEIVRLAEIEADNELLNNSLRALSTHFAQVQLRLQQIVESDISDSANLEQRNEMLNELQQFANRGIPELMVQSMSHKGYSVKSWISGASNLFRSNSMATSLMADDVFDDDDDEIDINIRDNESSSDDDFDRDNDFNRKFRQPRPKSSTTIGNNDHLLVSEEFINEQRARQRELIEQLKHQLDELEQYAYEAGDPETVPSLMSLEKRNVIIEEIRSKLPVFSLDEIDRWSNEELRKRVDIAVRQLINPTIMKEQLVEQLRTQVTDLERFIKFLQTGAKDKRLFNLDSLPNDSASDRSSLINRILKLNRKKNRHQKMKMEQMKPKVESEPKQKPVDSAQSKNENEKLTKKESTNQSSSSNNDNNNEAMNIMKRIMSLLQMFTLTHLGQNNQSKSNVEVPTARESGNCFEQNSMKKATKHWGDLRASLELSINSVLELYRKNNLGNDSDYTSDQEDFISIGNVKYVSDNYFAYEQMSTLVRKELVQSLRALLQHGLSGAYEQGLVLVQVGPNGKPRPSGPVVQSGASLLSIGLGCFGLYSDQISQSGSGSALNNTANNPIGYQSNKKPIHAWELILYYYHLKNGMKHRATPTRRLSKSFGLNVISPSGSRPSSSAGRKIGHHSMGYCKQLLLSTIDDIIDSHTRMNRSMDSHFKAFVCMALNARMLSSWLRLIVRNGTIVENCYEKWSYTAMTGFEDTLRQLDRFSTMRFCLPADIAIRQLQNIHDAF